MTSRLRVLLLVLTLMWQPFSALLPAGLAARAEQLAHAMVHEQALGHHHHADASLHIDDGELSHQHVFDGMQTPALAAAPPKIGPVPAGSGVTAMDPLTPASADPHRLMRPPRPASA